MQGGPQQQQQDAAASAQQQSGVPDASAAAPEAAAAASSVDLRQIAQLLATFACNSHTICDEELRPIGVGLYPLGALINHGCRPNCVQTFAGRNIVFRCVAGAQGLLEC
jgi:SET and MYND domain-containing protein